MNIAQNLERAARYHGSRTALVFQGRRWTFSELDRQASSLAAGLKTLGLKPGERLGLHLPNWPEFVLTYYAANKIGVVPIALNVTYKADEIAYIVGDGEAVAVVTADAVAANLPPRCELPSVKHMVRVPGPSGAGPAAALAGSVRFESLTGDPTLRALDLDRTETCAILYTSATTGRPKGVMLTHENVVSNTWAVNHHLRMTRDDIGLCALPLFHCFGQNFIMNALVNAGATLALEERFVLDGFVAAVGARRATLLYAVPTMYILMLAADMSGCDLASLRSASFPDPLASPSAAARPATLRSASFPDPLASPSAAARPATLRSASFPDPLASPSAAARPAALRSASFPDPLASPAAAARPAALRSASFPDPLASPAAAARPAALRLCFSAAASLPSETERLWKERTGHDIHQGYGLTECSPFASYNHETAFRAGSVGTPIENVEMKVVDPGSGRLVKDGELGEIVIKGPNVMKGYFRNPEATAQAVRDGWLHSGDIGYRDPDGYFYIVDRVKDMINVSGFKVFPREVEEVLFLHPAIKEVAVLGRPDPVRGEAVKAFVVLKEGQSADAESLRALCRERIASYKVPEEIEFISALPKNPTGKILKKELRGARQP